MVDFTTKYDVLYSKLESYSWLHYCLCCSQRGNHLSLMHCMSSFLRFPVKAQLMFTKAPLLFALKLLVTSIEALQYFSLSFPALCSKPPDICAVFKDSPHPMTSFLFPLHAYGWNKLGCHFAVSKNFFSFGNSRSLGTSAGVVICSTFSATFASP